MSRTLDQMLANENLEVELSEGLTAALARISAAGDIDDQVNREILRYWHDQIAQTGDNADELRRVRAIIFQWIQHNP